LALPAVWGLRQGSEEHTPVTGFIAVAAILMRGDCVLFEVLWELVSVTEVFVQLTIASTLELKLA